jgi:hypothetical protein
MDVHDTPQAPADSDEDRAHSLDEAGIPALIPRRSDFDDYEMDDTTASVRRLRALAASAADVASLSAPFRRLTVQASTDNDKAKSKQTRIVSWC